MATSTAKTLLDNLKSAFARADRHAINQAVSGLIDLPVALGRQWATLADVMVHNGELALARRSIERFVAEERHVPNALFHQAMIVARCGDPAAAREILAKLPADVPDRANRCYILGTAEMNLGNFTAARSYLKEGLRANPTGGHLWLSLAMITRGADDEQAVAAALDAAGPMARAAASERGPYHFACGKLLADLGRHGDAQSAFAEGAAAVSSERRYNADADAARAADAIDGWEPAAVRAIGERVTLATNRPIIVTGTPRSGTTLVEQILASHSEVVGGEELGRFGLVRTSIGCSSSAGAFGWLDHGRSADDVPRDFLHLLTERFGASGRVIDKTPEASRYLGTLAAFLPDTPLIWLRRDVLDRAWSCFRTFFVRGVSWSNRFEDIAMHFKLEDMLLERWQAILGERLLVINYEEIATNSASAIPRILAHCGLNEEPAVFMPHKTTRPVMTASVMQVREPINQAGIGASTPYHAFMKPFIDAYYG